ncbi:MAG: hypothetical protein L0H93_08325 [Nocardioides sp.]|nr:hypothetical protein [Nocardioides sp.]
MNRVLLRMQPRTAEVVTSTRHRICFIGFLAAVGFVLVLCPMMVVEERGALQVVGICFTVVAYLAAAGAGCALLRPRKGRLVVLQDHQRGLVIVPSWRPLRLLVVIGLVAMAVLVAAVTLGLVQGTITGRDSRWLLAMALATLAVVPHAVRFVLNGARVDMELTSDPLRYRSAFSDESIDWRSVHSVELVAEPRARIRVRQGGSTLDLVPGLFDSDPRLIVDLLHVVRRRPKMLDGLEGNDVELMLQHA